MESFGKLSVGVLLIPSDFLMIIATSSSYLDNVMHVRVWLG